MEPSHRQPEQGGFVHSVRKAGFPGWKATHGMIVEYLTRAWLSRKIPLVGTERLLWAFRLFFSLSENRS